MPETDEHGHVCECGQSFQNPDKLQRHITLHRLETEQEQSTRQPNREELTEVVEWYTNRYQLGYREAVETVNQCHYILIENYITGCPGYAGRLLIEIGSAGPNHYNVYTWSTGDIQRRNRSEELNETGGRDGAN